LKTKIAIYGLTTEGYLLASKMIDRTAITIIDETLQMAMELEPQTMKLHRNVSELVDDEALMALKPIPQVISEAAVIFFTPKLRKTGDESVIEASTKLREAVKYSSKGATIVNTLPTGIGGNADNITLVEKQTGLRVGETLNYSYCPLTPRSGEPKFLASVASLKDALIFEVLGAKRVFNSITLVELEYISMLLSESIKLTTEIELMRRAREYKIKDGIGSSEKYIDELASRLYDLTAILASEDVGEPITYLASAAIKSLENYVRYLVDKTRDLLRELQLKASKTKVLVAWSGDKYEMRADRLKTAEEMVERLRDYVTDVEHVQNTKTSQGSQVNPYKHNIAIACSASDYEWVKSAKKSIRGSEISILKATPELPHEKP
jgi:hypothetical protein